ncbi:MAG: hypothetical protein EDQ89_11775 [Acidobacteria bacterium]|nr:MAG: hypothetical protein EDQ89_11775 [Acidobacteriota bacterium]
MRPKRLLLGLLIAVAAIGAATASAAGTKSSVDVPGAGFAETRTDCPKGTALVSQGFGTKSFSTDGSGSTVVRIDSHRSGSGLESRAVNFNTVPGVFTAYAYCSRQGREIDVVRERVFVPPGSAGVAKATCPRGSVPVAGGFASPGFTEGGMLTIVLTSRRQGRSWRVEGINEGGSSRGGILTSSLVAYAYCLADAPKVTIRKKRKPVGGELKAIVATCPKGRKAIGGGFDGNIELLGTARAGGAVISRRAKRGRAWKIRAVSVSELPDATATAYAYCLKS